MKSSHRFILALCGVGLILAGMWVFSYIRYGYATATIGDLTLGSRMENGVILFGAKLEPKSRPGFEWESENSDLTSESYRKGWIWPQIERVPDYLILIIPFWLPSLFVLVGLLILMGRNRRGEDEPERAGEG